MDSTSVEKGGMHLFYKYFKEKKAGLLRLLVNLLWACSVLIPPGLPGSSEEGSGGKGVVLLHVCSSIALLGTRAKEAAVV